MFALPKIYPITDSRITHLSHAKQCQILIDSGANFIQIREKSALTDEFYTSAKDALEIAREQNVKILINDRVDIALAINADGVHLGQDDLPTENARDILGKDAIIGVSTHNLKQAKDALKLPIDYIAIGPVFATSTKENTDKIVGLEGVKKVREAIGAFPLVAIGGIKFENYKKVLNAGADSVAIISEILKDSQNISHNFDRFNSN